jgi:hypothetical protein
MNISQPLRQNEDELLQQSELKQELEHEMQINVLCRVISIRRTKFHIQELSNL